GIRLWDVATGRQEQEFLPGRQASFSRALFLPDGKTVLAWYLGDNRLHLWDVPTGRLLRTFDGHNARVNSAAVSADGRFALSAGGEKTVRLWEVASGKEVRKLDASAGFFSPDGKQILAFGADKTARLWDVATGKEVCGLEGHNGEGAALFSP